MKKQTLILSLLAIIFFGLGKEYVKANDTESAKLPHYFIFFNYDSACEDNSIKIVVNGIGLQGENVYDVTYYGSLVDKHYWTPIKYGTVTITVEGCRPIVRYIYSEPPEGDLYFTLSCNGQVPHDFTKLL
jgi:hypothetical protein